MAAREREGRATPNREGVFEEVVDRKRWDGPMGWEGKNVLGRDVMGQWEGREKIDLERVVKEDENWREESRGERVNWWRELCGGDQ